MPTPKEPVNGQLSATERLFLFRILNDERSKYGPEDSMVVRDYLESGRASASDHAYYERQRIARARKLLMVNTIISKLNTKHG